MKAISNKSHSDFLILIVDDYISNLKLLGTVFEKAGFRVKLANSGYKALNIAEKEKPDLILLDIVMPGLDGYQVCCTLKDNDKTKEIPVFFLTAMSQPEDLEAGYEAGAVDYVIKPFNYLTLINQVKKHLNISKKALCAQVV